MQAKHTPVRSAGGESGAEHSHGFILRFVFYALTGLLLLAISTSVYFSNRLINIFDKSAQINKTWNERIGEYSELQFWAVAVKASYKEAFISPNVQAQSLVTNALLTHLDQLLAAVRENIRNDSGLSKEDANLLREDMERFDAGLDAVEAEGKLLFSLIENNQRNKASERSVDRDRKFTDLFTESQILNMHASDVQRRLLEKQQRVAISLNRFEYIVVFFLLLMVAGLVVYGEMMLRKRKLAYQERKRFLDRIAASEERSRLLLDSTAEGIYGIDLDGNCTFCNPACARILGYDRPEDLLRKNMHSVMHHTRPDGTPYPLNECITSRAFKKVEGTYANNEVLWRKDGSSFPAEYWSYPVRRDGEVIGAVVAFLDITKRKRDEEALRTSEAKYRGLFEDSRDALMTLAPPSWAFTSGNPAAVQMFRAKDEKDFTSHGPWDLSPEWQPDGRASSEKAKEMIETAMREGSHFFEWTHRRLGGEEFPADVLLTRVEEGGEAILQATVRDITDRKRAEEQNRLQVAALENAANAVVMTDTEGMILWVNPAFTSLTGYPAEEAIGKHTRLLRSGRQNPEFYADLWQTIKRGQVWRGELINRKKDGSFYTEGMTIAPIRDSLGAITRYVAIKQDVTERKRAEEALSQAKDAAEAASRAKSEFLANMSHEIRTPFNAIVGMTELALDTELTPEQREYLNTVKSATGSLLTVINDILDFSKIEAGKLEMDRIDFRLRETIEDTMRMLALRAHEKGLELACRISQGIPEILIGDPDRLRQIIVNLTGNAIKFTASGEVIVNVEVESQTKNDVFLHFTVKDTGIGIPADKQQMIFQAFSQADTSTTRRYGGTGLGLAIASRLVKVMGGNLWLESEAGKGSTFHFTARFPVQQHPTVAPVSKGTAHLVDVPVLVVDDNATNRRILEEMLLRWGMRPTSVPSGPAALAALKAASEEGEPFPLTLLDVNMPGMDGFEVAERIREVPAWGGTSVMMLTSSSCKGDLDRCRELGLAAYLIKPVRRTELLERILTVMGKETEKNEAELAVGSLAEKRGIQGVRILLAEDNPVNQLVAIRMLQKQEHQVTVAGNGREALLALETTAFAGFDLVLMDVQMPEMDGLAATAAIREREKETNRHIPIVAMTAHAMKGDREMCLAAGMDAYVSKPIHAQELTEIIETLTRAPIEAARDMGRPARNASCPGQKHGQRFHLKTSDNLLLTSNVGAEAGPRFNITSRGVNRMEESEKQQFQQPFKRFLLVSF